MTKHSPARIARIREYLHDFEARGIAVTDSAREIGVSAWTVCSWKRRFGAEQSDERRAQRLAGPTAPVELVEIRGVRPSPAACIEIQVGDITIRVPSASIVDGVRTVLEAVKSC